MKASERRLLMVLGVMTAVCGGAILSRRLLTKQHSIELREHMFELKRMESTALMAEAGLWEQRLEWLRARQPAMTSVNQASEELLETLLSSAESQGLVVQKKQLHEPVTAAFHRETGVTLTVKSELAAVFRWMHGLLAPDFFRIVAQLKITPDAADPSEVITVVHFSQLHATDAASEASPGKKKGI